MQLSAHCAFWDMFVATKMLNYQDCRSFQLLKAQLAMRSPFCLRSASPKNGTPQDLSWFAASATSVAIWRPRAPK